MKSKPQPESVTPKSTRKHRARPTPRWLAEQQDLDEMARRRCLLVLSVLAGEKPVTDAISEAKISRGLYYQLEEKALRAMLRALAPGASSEGDGTSGADGLMRHVSQLQEKVNKLEVEKRRLERLLYLTRKVLPSGRVATPGLGRPRKASSPPFSTKGTTAQRSRPPGRRPSPSSARLNTAPATEAPPMAAPASTPTSTSEGAP